MNESTEIAAALSRVRESAKVNQSSVVRSQQMLRTDRELLLRTKWLQEIIKGWYLLVKPDVMPGVLLSDMPIFGIFYVYTLSTILERVIASQQKVL